MLRFLDQRSYLSIIIISVLTGIVIALPVSFLFGGNVPLGQRLTGKFIRPTGVPVAEKQPIGPIPDQPPHIGRVFPWVGKIGDVVWIQGKHFGDNPSVKQLRIGGVTVKEAGIMRWYDQEIQAIIPAGARQGGMVEIQVGAYAPSQSVPFVLYDTQTKRKLSKQGTQLFTTQGEIVRQVTLWFGDETMPILVQEVPVQSALSGNTFLADIGTKPLLSVVLSDDRGYVVPYYVDPQEFGF